MARKTYVPLSTRQYSENPKQMRTRRSFTMGGLPPGATALVYDTMYQIEVNNKYRGVAVDNILIDSDGYIRLENLRDSRYSIEFQNIDYIKYNFQFEIGDPSEFSNLVYHEIPYPVIITSVVGALDGSNNANIQINWELDSHNIDGYYEIWISPNNPNSFYSVTTISNVRARTYTVANVDYSIWYYVKILTLNEDNLSRGYSNIVSGLTPDNPIYVSGGAPLDTEAPIGATFYNY
jgi:hypothetical protein